MTLEEAVAAWNEDEIFRATFLHHFTRPQDRQLFEELGRLLTELWAESEVHWPSYTGSPVRREFEACLEDLRASYHFMCVIATEPEASGVSVEDQYLACEAHRLAEQLSALLEDGRRIVETSRQPPRNLTRPPDEGVMAPPPEAVPPAPPGALWPVLGAAALAGLLWVATRRPSR